MDIFLELTDMRIIRCEKTQRLLFFSREVKIIQLLEQIHQIALSQDILVDFVRLHREIMP